MLRIWSALIVGFIAAAAAVTFANQPASGASGVKVCGSGYGHGIGLSQYGAYGRARAGQGYGHIIRSYYRGVSVQRYQDSPTARVLLGETSINSYQDVTVRSGSKARLKNLSNKATVNLSPGTYRVQYLSGRKLYRVTDLLRRKSVGAFRGPILFQRVSGGPLGYGRSSYRGNLLARTSGSKLLLVNHVGLEGYIRGVVPNEMPSSWAKEALKSQAVAARSYARATERSGAFDFYADTRDQVYKGASSETPATNRAVSETARAVAVRDGRPITAFFHSSSGGFTEDSAYVFNPSPYLKALRDSDSRGRAYEGRAGSPWTRWSGTLDANGSSSLGVGSISNVRILSKSPSGRATKVEVTGSRGRKIITGQYNIRYGLKSTGLQRADGSRYPAGVLPSARVNFGRACG